MRVEAERLAQFLNSVLSSIGGDGQQTALPPPQAQPRPKPSVNGLNPDLKPKIVTSQTNGPIPGQKRKAEDSLPPPKAKSLKNELGQRQANGTAPAVGRLASKDVTRPTISTSKSVLAVPYRGTSRPSPTSASPDPPTTDASKTAPKKGSYAEIMARASANNKPPVGVIKHKPKEAISAKKEIMMRKKGILPKGKPRPKDPQNGNPRKDRENPLPFPANAKTPGVPRKKIPQPSYKGTAAPKSQPAYKGTMNPKSFIADTARRKDSRDERSRSNSINPPCRGRDNRTEDEEDEIDEEEIYSDESEDMEAGFSDVEEEETAALRAAKKDDVEELRREIRLKKEKDERKKKLAAMAAKAPKPRF